ncbi:Exopolysaccharide biosynthesis protein YbjH [Burkholderiaceae bacterium]
MAPSGYTAVINVPTADVLPLGTLAGSWSNSNPESPRNYSGFGPFGGYNLGFGVLPNLEMVGRLTYDGHLNCDLYDAATCKSTTRDLSVGAKYRLPLPSLPFNTRVAVGVSDYGGAATNYRQAYGVATSNLGPLELSLGKSRAQASGLGGGLMSGMFGGVSLNVNDHLKLLAESDTREKRVGAAYQWRPVPDWGVAVGASRKLSHNSPQKAEQLTVTLTYDMDGAALRNGKPAGPYLAPISVRYEPNPTPAPVVLPVSQTSVIKPNEPLPTQQLPTYSPSDPPADPAPFAQDLAARMQAAGFSEVSVGKEGALWHVQAEPRSWRKNRLDALSAALAVWLKLKEDSTEEVLFTLTYLQNPVLQAKTNGACLAHYLKGVGLCNQQPLQLKSEPMAMKRQLAHVAWLVTGHAPQFLRPDFELSPSASYGVGSEFGLVDYSLGVSKGWELPLYKGLVWHGYHTQLLTQTDDFQNQQSYFRRVGLGEKTAWGANMLSYTRPLYTGLWSEVTTGYLSSGVKGSNLTMVWDSPDSRWKLTGVNAVYTQDHAPEAAPLHPTFMTVRYAVVPGKWALSATNGRFLNNDTGTQVMTTHFFGDHRVRFYYRKTGPGNGVTPNRRAFAGFNFTLPIGPKESYTVGPATVRGRDQWALGLETKVQEKDNYIEPGYGVFPTIRHGLQADVTDYERGDVGYLEANMHRFWAGLREQMGRK